MSKPTGYILTSKMRAIDQKQHAWHDSIMYECPIVGQFNMEKVIVALQKKFWRAGAFPGSSYGATSVQFISFDSSNQTIRFEVSVGIGD